MLEPQKPFVFNLAKHFDVRFLTRGQANACETVARKEGLWEGEYYHPTTPGMGVGADGPQPIDGDLRLCNDDFHRRMSTCRVGMLEAQKLLSSTRAGDQEEGAVLFAASVWAWHAWRSVTDVWEANPFFWNPPIPRGLGRWDRSSDGDRDANSLMEWPNLFFEGWGAGATFYDTWLNPYELERYWINPILRMSSWTGGLGLNVKPNRAQDQWAPDRQTERDQKGFGARLVPGGVGLNGVKIGACSPKFVKLFCEPIQWYQNSRGWGLQGFGRTDFPLDLVGATIRWTETLAAYEQADGLVYQLGRWMNLPPSEASDWRSELSFQPGRADMKAMRRLLGSINTWKNQKVPLVADELLELSIRDVRRVGTGVLKETRG